ncbi:MAG: hypothetical protein LBL91_00690 [Lachnospiraceae bacterium]|jgi:ABC-type antimicrobial peptide transport system permease subunit|nr:hypothetical protein [Lachnospiraceae bacterium]
MNVMLVSVTERTKEIGIRKSLRSKENRYTNSVFSGSISFKFTTEEFLGIIVGVSLGGLSSKIRICI